VGRKSGIIELAFLQGVTIPVSDLSNLQNFHFKKRTKQQ